MSTVLVIDAACDLPRQFIDERGIQVLPISIRIDGQTFTDDKDARTLTDFYAQGLLGRDHDAESLPYTAEQIEALFLDRIVRDYDFALVETVSRERSPIFDNATKASHAILGSYRDVRADAGREGGFGIRVMNTGTVFTGQGVLAAFTSDMIQKGKSKNEILRLTESMRRKVYAYIVPPDVYYIRERARKKGDDSIGMISALAAKSFDIVPILCGRDDATYPVVKGRGFKVMVDRLFRYAINHIKAGLLTPYVVVSIAGDLNELLAMDSFLELEQVAKDHDVQVLSCVMGLTAGLNVGPGCIGLALATEEHEFDG